MLTVLVAILLGVVEGLTEFIPVSSTGHMILTAKLMGINDQSELLKSFEIAIQLGAILAITIVYWNRILSMFGLKQQTVSKGYVPQKQLNLLHVALGITPALLTAYLAKDFIKNLFSASTVLWALVAGAIFMVAAEWVGSRRRPSAETLDNISYGQALMIGIYQIISVLWPGFSRSGSTMSGGMLSGVSYRAAADFSFLMAIPIMIVVCGYELMNSYKLFTPGVLGFFALGFIVSFAVAYIVVVAFLSHIQNIKLWHFAIYRLVLAGTFWFFVMR
ncbi:undecaprenyl-diphosphate phosphatase [Paenibacillus sp. UMB4589-SE434]|uniref:undecaprenyl-diphosphate phosphatase n=1 Tax=Paenibacillus sp. UMB4589-SE434 TaxID=3046314 RepID=UPI00254AEFCF|nr:undecaprenyl-diphosphate phosphatase [Paenibacillus sp. UMB4589-SE434]MDK8182279.1 undecaprenyl-diphosphate phosphatase [Paenibacillus sp. UMB4589-SE434]